MQPDEALMDKLSKILTLRDRAGTEGEAIAAAEMLNKLLAKHNLDIADLEKRGHKKAATVGEKGFDLGKAAFNWKLDLAEVIAKHYFCHALVNRSNKTVVFVGRPDNTEALSMLYGWVVDQIRRIASEERKKLTYHIDPLRWQVNFGLGAVKRLKERLEEIKRQQAADVETQALVFHHDTEISDYMEEKYGYRTDGQKTKQRQQWDEEWEQEKQRQGLLFISCWLTGNVAAYRLQYPFDRRAWTQAERDAWEEKARKEDEAYWKKEEAKARRRKGRRERHMSDEEWRKVDEGHIAQRSGQSAADRVNLSPFLKGGDEIKREILG